MNHFFTVLSALWIVLLIIHFKAESVSPKIKTLGVVIAIVIAGLYIYNLTQTFNIQNVVTLLIMLAVIALTFVKGRKMLILRNVLSALSGLVMFVHFVIFNIIQI